jgi:hypothetical protein
MEEIGSIERTNTFILGRRQLDGGNGRVCGVREREIKIEGEKEEGIIPLE